MLEIHKVGFLNFFHLWNGFSYSASDMVISFTGNTMYLRATNGRIIFLKEGFNYTDVRIYDDTASGTVESFANVEALQQRLIDLGHPAYAQQGSVIVPENFSDLNDVAITSPTTGQVPVFNEVSGKWENSTPAGGGDMLKSVYDPANIVQQLVGLVASQTLTNKTLTSPVLNTAVSGSAVLDDDTFATASNTTLATSESIKAYVDANVGSLVNGMVYKGNWDASAGTFPGVGVAKVGWFYYVNVGGTVGGVVFDVGDNIIAIVDNASTTVYASNWSKHDQTDAVQSVAGLIGTITASALRSSLNVEDGADVTDAVNIGTSINGATAKTTPVDADAFPLLDSDASNVLKKVTWANIKTTLNSVYQAILTETTFGTFINSLTAKATPIDADYINITDTADSNKQKKTTLTQFKAFLKTYFDTVYQLNLQAEWTAGTTLLATHNRAMIFTVGFTTTINPNTETYQTNFEAFLDNTGSASAASIVCTAATGYTYSVNGATAVASGTFSLPSKKLCYITRKLGTNLIKINGDVS